MPQPKQSPARKIVNDFKVKYSPVKKLNNKHNNVFVKGYKFALMTLEFKKFSDPNEDAYYKDFLDLLDTSPKVGNDLGIIKVVFVRDLSRCSGVSLALALALFLKYDSLQEFHCL